MARIAVLGAGAWGTALAVAAAPRHEVLLWARAPAQAQALAAACENVRYLPGIALPPQLTVTADWPAALAHPSGADALFVIATPVSGLRSTLSALNRGGGRVPVVWLCKGLERDSHALGHQIVAAELPRRAAGPLSGPSFAVEVARGLPTALTVAGAADFCAGVTAVFHGGALRIYSSDDVIGVEVGGAVKNVLAIATGIADALGLGANARAALITRGLAEITRFGVALGARAETFMGLAGVGDLILTCTGELSRNRRVGLMLGEGARLEAVLADIGHVAEGVWSAPAVARRAQALGVDMPLTAAVCAVLEGRFSPRAALTQLLARDPKPETLQ
jgi:glycerol-3-phosphate dehydrogenase (NAD(P)+)